MARVKVTVSYLSKDTVNLIKDDGEVYMTLHAGDSFHIDNQMREWNVVREPKKTGKGTILVCEKYRDNGDVLESFALPNHKVGLWATTSGSARNGVFHCYNPKDGVEDIIDSTQCADRRDASISARDDMQWEDGVFIDHLLTDGVVTSALGELYYTVENATYMFNFAYDPETNRFGVKLLWYTSQGLHRAMECLLWIDRYNDPERHEKIMANHPEWDEYDHWAPDDPQFDFHSQVVKWTESVRTDGVIVNNDDRLYVYGGVQTKLWDSDDTYGEEPYVGRFLEFANNRGCCNVTATTKAGQEVTVKVDDLTCPDVDGKVLSGRLNSYREVKVFIGNVLVQYLRTREGKFLDDTPALCNAVADVWRECPGEMHPFSVNVREETNGRYGTYVIVHGDSETRRFVQDRWTES